MLTQPNLRHDRGEFRLPVQWILMIASAMVLGMTGAGAAQEPPPDFAGAPLYEIGEIPPQNVWQGRPTRFRVRATGLTAPVEASYVQPPSGGIFFQSGDFQYASGPSDKASFSVTFAAGTGLQRRVQTVSFQPIVLLRPEEDVLGVDRLGVPDPTSRDYIVEAATTNPTKTLFNNILRNLRTIVISGRDVVIRKGHSNGLYERYFDPSAGIEDIAKFSIEADRVVIASPSRLRGTDLVIRARTLVFEDSETEYASLSTEPTSLTTRAQDVGTSTRSKGDDGKDGNRAGIVDVFVEQVSIPSLPQGLPPSFKRFVANGGRGQDGGYGRNGTAKRDAVLVYSKYPSLLSGSSTSWQRSCTVYVQYRDDGGPFDGPDWNLWNGRTGRVPGDDCGGACFDSGDVAKTVGGQQFQANKPVAGGDAVPSGKPGAGGAGGAVRSNVQGVLDASESSGGSAGATLAFKGGGTATPPIGRLCVSTTDMNNSTKVSYALAEANASYVPKDAPAPAASPGTPGGFELTGDGREFPWVSPLALRQVVNHAKDAYLDGEVEYVAQVLGGEQGYSAILHRVRASSDWASYSVDEQHDMNLLDEEMQLMLLRISNGLDYFGNPPGWVPGLSLQANYVAFSGEVDRALGVLYLQRWLGASGRTLQQKVDGIKEARIQLSTDSADKSKALAEMSDQVLPALSDRVLRTDDEIKNTQLELQAQEATLLNQAEAKARGPLWRRIATGLGAICKLVPFPAFQAVGAGLDIVSRIDLNSASSAWDSIRGVSDVVASYRNGGFNEAARQAKTTIQQIDFPNLPGKFDYGQVKTYISGVQGATGKLKETLGGIRAAFEGSAAPKTQVEAELAKLKAASPEFQTLAGRVARLLEAKEGLVAEVTRVIQEVNNLTQGIEANLLAMDAMNVDFVQASGAYDVRTISYIDDMGRRAKERLLLYHYFMKKSYEYLLLEPYTARLDLDKKFESFIKIAEADQSGVPRLTPEQFALMRGVYDDVLSEVVRTVVTLYNSNDIQKNIPIYLGFTSEEIEQLNRGEDVILDLRTLGGTGLFPSTEEDIRISNVAVEQIRVTGTENSLASDYLDLKVEHLGSSEIRTTVDGVPRNYTFSHYSRDTQRPTSWKGRYVPKLDKLVMETPSISALTLLGTLLDKVDTVDGEPGRVRSAFFANLGGLAKLRVRVDKRAFSGADKLVLREAILRVDYDKRDRGASSPLRSLTVSTSGDLLPLVEVSSPDRAGRQDGQGVFSRTYGEKSSVTISVPATYGRFRFDRFVDLGGASLARASGLDGPRVFKRANPEAPSLVSMALGDGTVKTTVTLGQDRFIQAQYVEAKYGCANGPSQGCAIARRQGARMTLIDRPNDLKDSMFWKWNGPWNASVAGFGDPTLTDSFEVCVFDGAGGARRLVLRAEAAAGADCGGSPCWKKTDTGFQYLDEGGAGDGITAFKLEASPDGLGTLRFSGSGVNVPMPLLPLVPPIVVQASSSAGPCWQATFSSTDVNRLVKVKGVSD